LPAEYPVAEILIRRIDAERKSVNRQSVLARASARGEATPRAMGDAGFCTIPAEQSQRREQTTKAALPDGDAASFFRSHGDVLLPHYLQHS